MNLRCADAIDRPAIRGLAEKLDLDYPGMDDDPFWVAEEDGEIVAACGLKDHPDCREICAVGVAENFRGRGAAKALILRVAEDVTGDIHLTTTKPEVFASLGFVPARPAPASLKDRPPGWCDGCDSSRCAVMVRRGR